MTNLVMCEGTDCLRKEHCLLFTEPPTAKNQAWLCMPVSVKDIPNCRFYKNNGGKGI